MSDLQKPQFRYDPQSIERKWQDYWQLQGTFAVENQPLSDAPKFYVLDMFPYPSGVGLHVGHPLGYIATDIVARYKRMSGYHVLHPMGFDAFGLPAEQFAVEHGVHPRVTTEKNISTMIRQLKAIGLGYDWDRKIATTDVSYYRWTQWIFLQLFHSYFDPVKNAARPIDELVQKLESEVYYLGLDNELIYETAVGLDALEGSPIGAKKYYELTPEQQRQAIDDHRLAYLAEVPVNWCPQLGTVLANEEVTNDGRSERGNHPVYRRPLKQWMLRITAYAERLIDDLENVNWPEPIKLMQRNWIGHSEGAIVDFPVEGSEDETISVYTTRPDTLFGATYMVLAPEHPLVDGLTTSEQKASVRAYRKAAMQKTDVDRQAESREKTGVFTGGYAINPVNNEKIPVWIADYVLWGYGTGAIMAVPGHDTRDFEFATKFGIEIKRVVAAPDQVDDIGNLLPEVPALTEAYPQPGIAVNSENADISLNGQATADAKKRVTLWLEEQGLGKGQIQYKLRDWLFSRQRYWGEPFPILHGPDGEVRAVDEKDLPVELPEMEDFKPQASDDPAAPPQPPLGRAPASWREVEIDGVRYTRELNTMPQWAGSCWYYLRYLDPKNEDRFVDPEVEAYWMGTSEDNPAGGVDLYVGGAEHAVLHLLYSRFWHKVLYDLGHVSSPEPFGRLFNQGYIQAYAYRDERGVAVPASEVVNSEGKPAAEVQGQKSEQFTWQGQPVTEEYGKMGKSLKNAVSPEEVGDEYGYDTLRLYEMYLGPLDQSKPWNTRDIVGVHRFLQRVWRNFINHETGDLLISDEPATEDMDRLLHRTIARVTDDMEKMSFNTAIAGLIELNNELVALEQIPRAVAEAFVIMLAPMAPHLGEELWSRIGYDTSVADAAWPRADQTKLTDAHVEIVVQIMGKVRGKITIASDADEKSTEAAALADPHIVELLKDKTVRKVIVVPGRLVNIVAN